MSQAELERLVLLGDVTQGIYPGDPIPDEDFKVLGHGQRGTSHHIDAVLVPVLHSRVETVALSGSHCHGGSDSEGNRVGFFYANVEMRDAKGILPLMNARTRKGREGRQAAQRRISCAKVEQGERKERKKSLTKRSY
jgi:hypothetical protein